MKAQISNCLLGCLLIITLQAVGGVEKGRGQKVSQRNGIYLTAADYRMGKLTLAADCRHEKNRILLHDFMGRPHLTVIHGGEKHVYAKDSIFGFRNCEGHDFRFFRHQPFEIEEPSAIVVYRQMKLETSNGNKTSKPRAVFYFSNGLDGAIMPLTKVALETAFPDNDKFRDMLDVYFKDDLSSYDTYHHTYRINRLLQASK